MAPPPADLRKIGVEGFDLIDKLYGPPRRSSATDAFPGRRDGTWVVHQVPNGEMQEPPINSREAAVHFGGIAVVNYCYHKGKPQNRWGRPIKP